MPLIFFFNYVLISPLLSPTLLLGAALLVALTVCNFYIIFCQQRFAEHEYNFLTASVRYNMFQSSRPEPDEVKGNLCLIRRCSFMKQNRVHFMHSRNPGLSWVVLESWGSVLDIYFLAIPTLIFFNSKLYWSSTGIHTLTL